MSQTYQKLISAYSVVQFFVNLVTSDLIFDLSAGFVRVSRDFDRVEVGLLILTLVELFLSLDR